MKQTAVEWLEEQVKKFHNWKQNPIYDENCFDEIELSKSINQAKEMEKQQAIEFAEWCLSELLNGSEPKEEPKQETLNK